MEKCRPRASTKANAGALIVMIAALLLVCAPTGCDGDESSNDPCQGVTCSGHGDCVAASGSATCECHAGYQPDGLACLEQQSDPCLDDVVCAGQHRQCIKGECGDCLTGFREESGQCLSDSTCGPTSCGDHGVCDDASGMVQCTCEPGYSGPTCTRGDQLTEDRPGGWTWVPFPDALCRDGSPAGLSVRYRNSSKDLVIFLEGGGLCIDPATCSGNPAKVMSNTPDYPLSILDDDPRNPVKDWNHIYIPYCTGDLHGGSNPNGMVPDVGPQKFVGGDNYRLFLQRIVPTFPDAERVLLTGLSAGGAGTIYNLPATAAAFGNSVRVIGAGDAMPLMRDAYLAPCLQKDVRILWELDEHLPADCAECSGANGGGIHHLHGYMATKYPNGSYGVISSAADQDISGFFGYGLDDCAREGGVLSPAEFTAGLEDLRTYLTAYPSWGTFFYPGNGHVSLIGARFFEMTVGGKALYQWYGELINGTIAHLGPE